MSHSEEALEQLQKEYVALQGRCSDVISNYLEREFTNERAQEFVRHGLCRRLQLMTRCIENVFSVLPPEFQGVPETDVIHDVTVHLQAFVFNAYGCLENLAHIWVLEKAVKKKNGDPLPRQWISFGSKNKAVLNSLPESFKEYLSEIGDWYHNIESFRHALAHRIPLYIPPGYLTQEKAVEYNDIQTRINRGMQAKDFETVDRLENVQAALLSFHPIATHSLGENANVVYFHAQMLSDFHTVREIASRLLPEFDE